MDETVSRPAISIAGLHKRYRSTWALRGLSLDVPRRSLFGLVGENGAGKTTLLRAILGLTIPTSGMVSVFDETPSRFSAPGRDLGALIERPALYPHLTVEENLRVFAYAGGLVLSDQRILDIASRLGLADLLNRKAGALSAGMRAKAAIAIAVAHQPRLVVLDEPAASLDPIGIVRLRELLVWLQSAGTTTLLSSHILSEVEALCDYVAVIHQGRLARVGRISELLRPKYGSLLRSADRENCEAALNDAGIPFALDAETIVVEGYTPSEVLRVLALRGVFPDHVEALASSLEDVVRSVAKEEDE